MAVEKAKKLNGKVAKHLATLALAKAIVEGDVAAARAALQNGADPEAYWIYGHTQLRELIKPDGPVRVTAGIKNLLTPQAIKKLPSMKEDQALWTRVFVGFVAKRGYDFKGKTMPLAGGGTDIQLDTAKDGVNLIEKKSRRPSERLAQLRLEVSDACEYMLDLGPLAGYLAVAPLLAFAQGAVLARLALHAIAPALHPEHLLPAP